MKIIFVGGSSFSGSTLLDMVLSNDPNGLSLGEIYALRFPFRQHHIQKRNDLIKTDPAWEAIINGPVRKFYPSISKMFPHKDFLVDSSKNPLWIYKNNMVLKEHDLAVDNILIYKTPVEIASSFAKRGREKEWPKSWLNYYKLYFSLIENFHVISYKDLVSDKESLKRICTSLDIKYSEEKMNFWEKKQRTFFGNNRTRYHTFDTNEDLKTFVKTNEIIYDSAEYRKIYYKEVTDEALIKEVEEIKIRNPQIKQVEDCLNSKTNIVKQPTNLKFTRFEIFIRKLKMKSKTHFYRIREVILKNFSP